jgi:molybdopterin-dependent oxidoreductase alpha subunit
LATHYLQVKINGDVAVFKGIMKEMLARKGSHGDGFDMAFIAEHTDGFDAFCRDLRDTSWEEIIASSGVSRDQIRAVAEVAMRSKNIICCWAMGLTQHKNAVATIQEIVNFLLLGGHIGRPGAGACPVRGHSNVQGDRTMGIWEAPSEAFLNSLAAEFGFEPPRQPGYHVVSAIQAMHAGLIDVFFAIGGNFLSASPDTGFTGQALRRCRLTVHVSTKLNRSHFVPGRSSLILPCLGRTERDVQEGEEQFVTVEDSMGVVHASRGVLKPASPECRSEVAIVAQLAAKTLGARSQINWHLLGTHYDVIRDHIARVIPGFERFNARVREPYGFCLPHAARDSRTFDTPTGKARFTVHPIPKSEAGPGQYTLMTIRSHDQYNTTIYGLDDRYRGISDGRRVLFMNTADMQRDGYRDGDLLDLVSHFEGETRKVSRFRVVPYDIPSGCLASYFPETNPLVPIGSFADKSFTPTSKSIIVSLRRHQVDG